MGAAATFDEFILQHVGSWGRGQACEQMTYRLIDTADACLSCTVLLPFYTIHAAEWMLPGTCGR